MAREYTITDIRSALTAITDEMLLQKETLTDIDSRLGDGDMGLSMEKSALAIRRTIEADSGKMPGKLLLQCAAASNRAAPSTLGTLLSFGLMAVGKEMGMQEKLDEALIARIPQILVSTIMRYGKAQEGDKTILDALCPYAREMESVYAATGDLKMAARAAAKAAHAGMEGTKGRVAKTGRAKWLAERNMEYPDGGAYLADAVAQRLCRLGDGTVAASKEESS